MTDDPTTHPNRGQTLVADAGSIDAAQATGRWIRCDTVAVRA